MKSESINRFNVIRLLLANVYTNQKSISNYLLYSYYYNSVRWIKQNMSLELLLSLLHEIKTIKHTSNLNNFMYFLLQELQRYGFILINGIIYLYSYCEIEFSDQLSLDEVLYLVKKIGRAHV